jgi:Na+/melibiose symporter-like transporter
MRKNGWSFKRIFALLAGLLLSATGFSLGAQRIPPGDITWIFFLSAAMAGVGTSILFILCTEFYMGRNG